MIWIGCPRCEKFRRNFVAQSFSLIAPVRQDLHQVSHSNEMVPNAAEYDFRVQWHGSDTFVAKNSDATSLHEHEFDQFCIEFHGVMKCSQMHPNITKYNRTWVSGSMIWIGCLRCKKCRRDFVVRTFTLIAPVLPVFHRVSWSNEMFPNALKHYKTH